MQKNTGSKKGETTRSGPAKPEPPSPDTPSGSSGFDLRRMLETLRLPGVDVAALIESRRKDVEAVVAANQRAVQGIEALTRRQAEILAATMNGWQEGTRDLLAAGTAPERANRSAGRAQQAFGEALANMRELAELVAKSHEDVIGIINARMQAHIDELRSQFGRRA